MKKNIKKYIKILGNIITIIAIIFVFKKLFNDEMDYSLLFTSRNIFPVIVIIIVQATIACVKCVTWRQLVAILSGKMVNFMECTRVYTKSNILKYIPGNVFQYVGRNELASENDINHADVAFSTVIDVAIDVLCALIISVILLFNQITSIVATIATTYRNTFLLIFGIIGTVVVIALVVAYLKFKDKLIGLIGRYIKVINVKNILILIGCIAYSTLLSVVSSLLYMIIFVYILRQSVDIQLFFNVFGAYSFSWLIGFITPGAPAGMGIKEAVMITISAGMISSEIIALSLVIFRVLSMVSDVVSFLFIQFICKISDR